MAKNNSGGWVESIKTVVYAGLIAIGIRTVAFEPFNIPSGSMEANSHHIRAAMLCSSSPTALA